MAKKIAEKRIDVGPVLVKSPEDLLAFFDQVAKEAKRHRIKPAAFQFTPPKTAPKRKKGDKVVIYYWYGPWLGTFWGMPKPKARKAA